MPAPSGPHIKTVYKPDGSMKQEPTGYGGKLCETAAAPYMARHGGSWESVETGEAKEPSYVELEQEQRNEEREHA